MRATRQQQEGIEQPQNVTPKTESLDDDGNADDDAPEIVPEKKKKPGFVDRIFTKLNLDTPTLLMMFKGSLPPTIGIAMYQAAPVAAYFSTLGYLVPIISVIALAILPRGKFLMNLFLNLIVVCFGSAIALLALWSSIKAREHTTPPGTPPTLLAPYNSSQSAVCAIWLFANIWFCNVVRAKLPSFNLPVIIYSILVNISATFGPFMATTPAAIAFVKQLLTAMLVALALATGVNLFVFPVSSRLVIFKEFAGAIGLLKKVVALQKAYLVKIESEDMFAAATRTDTMAQAESEAKGKKKGGNGPKLTKEAKAAKVLEQTGAAMRELAGKMHADLPFAKRDFAWGKLDAKDLGEMFILFRNVYTPVLGMTTIIDIFKRVSERRGWNIGDDAPEEVVAEKNMEKRVWNEVMRQMHEPFEILSEAIVQGLDHIGICLELLPQPKKQSNKAAKGADVDVEARGEELQPGESGFSRIVDEKVALFNAKRGELLRKWVKQGGLPADEEQDDYEYTEERRERDQVQLYILLFMENLMHASGEAIQDLMAFADKKVEDGTMKNKRLIFPSFRRLRRWFVGILSNEDTSAEQAPDLMETNNTIVYFGDGYNQKKDPEHLPPATAWEHFGNGLRKVSEFFGSEESIFGFRVACATMTIGIVAFLESTQRFFMEQRLVWAMIIIAIGMTMTSGQSFFGFLCRVGGTVIAMVFSLIIWYIANEHTPGVIVFLWLSLFIDYYFFLKFPRFIPAVMITIVTQVLIIGYELQVLKIGQAVAERTGQRWYPTYELAPYRLACVAGGSLIAFIWTVFPSPLTDRTWLRRDLSATLYLIANYFSVINSTLQAKIDNTAGDMSVPGTPAHQLFKIRRKIFGKIQMLIPSMSQHSDWQRFEPTIGGKFPREAYDQIILRSTRIMGYLALMSYTITHPDHVRPGISKPKEKRPVPNQQLEEEQGEPSSRPPSIAAIIDDKDDAWIKALAEVMASFSTTHHTILSTLTLLSNSLLSGQSLPPFLPLPRPYEMTRRLMQARRYNTNGSEDEDEDEELPPFKLVDSHTGRDDDMNDHPLPSRSVGDVVGMDILDPKNMEQPGYAEFAVIQVCIALVCDDLEVLVRAVSGLVGVVDFSFRVDESKKKTGGHALGAGVGSVSSSTLAGGGGAIDLKKSVSRMLSKRGKGKGKAE
ncbi:hypothetical protein B0T17DRAFT_485663 [Bombardia bombarda]|uniref:ER transporter 6TM N-terminal domain-containing protein n=1 Tax=Bombardia bombarda TaxID=252184 RepID=A0AA40CGJ2_9PEZI|nr:hypothetical protein B0T17DRAFT_485663 [Bombardia bombarda]